LVKTKTKEREQRSTRERMGTAGKFENLGRKENTFRGIVPLLRLRDLRPSNPAQYAH